MQLRPLSNVAELRLSRFKIEETKDIDDSSFVYYFAEASGSTAADPKFELKHMVFLN